MKSKVFYIYRFINNDNKVTYIGKANHLIDRLTDHRNNGHLPAHCYSTIEHVEYMEFGSEVDSFVAEFYFINKYKPVFNTANKKVGTLSIGFQLNNEWIRFKPDFFDSLAYEMSTDELVAHMEKEVARLESEVYRANKDLVVNAKKLRKTEKGYDELVTKCSELEKKIISIEDEFAWRNTPKSLKFWRHVKGIGREKLATKIGLSEYAVKKMENEGFSKVTLETVLEIVDVLEIDLAQLKLKEDK